jgi:hypothetical protein
MVIGPRSSSVKLKSHHQDINERVAGQQGAVNRRRMREVEGHLTKVNHMLV